MRFHMMRDENKKKLRVQRYNYLQKITRTQLKKYKSIGTKLVIKPDVHAEAVVWTNKFHVVLLEQETSLHWKE